MANLLLPTTPRRWFATLALVTAITVGVPVASSVIFAPERPIRVEGTTVSWETEAKDSIRVHMESRTYTTTCPEVLISRWLVTSHGRVDATAFPLSGPLTKQARELPPHRVVSIHPISLPGNELRIPIPPWLLKPGVRETVLGVGGEVSVPSDKPCGNGFTGRYPLYELLLPSVRGTPALEGENEPVGKPDP